MKNFQKRLDKAMISLYTNRSSKGKGDEVFQMQNPNIETNKAILEISEKIKEVFSSHFPEIRLPVIAGGAVRDAFLNQLPKDYDIFVDLSPYETDEEAEDSLLLMAFHLSEAFDRQFHEASGGNRDYTGLVKDDPNAFAVYNIEATVLFGETPYQLIGRRNAELLSTDPLAWVTETFDYSLVKALFDPLEGRYLFSEEFLTSFKNKEVTFPTQASFIRGGERIPNSWKKTCLDLPKVLVDIECLDWNKSVRLFNKEVFVI